ncbi:helix-turn-helix domain-containing protein [Peterkaempfera bronchialis]|uniref:Helix-turn-helix transcriptional regulator n=1 Tax=Peterkaempfera bronchialis TaxID=2126346 RepID=A0A345STD5_9ACTN|nr:helix-turn-helix domain-containing protein [Peterkaempfera bronchialis]AXI76990.1 helix-turn-helix transcriptional regulator [Peterkaempfera bronchialis]
MLGFVGLDDREESAYRALVGVGAAAAPELARRLGAAEDEIAVALRRLEQRGLAAPSPGRPERYVAAPPAVALGALLSQRRHELDQAELAVSALAREYRVGAADMAAHDLMEVVTGLEAVRHRFEQLQLGARREVLAMVTARPVAVTGEENAAEERAVERGVAYRVVVERSLLSRPGGLVELAAALGRDEQVRMVDAVPSKLIVADRSMALIPLTAGSASTEPAALVVHASGLLEALVGLFEAVWEHARPVRLSGAVAEQSEPDQPDGTDLQILSLLLMGLTDSSVAKQLELGLRTVQRRVKRLMDMAAVSTRMQLGWHAYEKGWVQRQPAGAQAAAPDDAARGA